MRVAAVNIRLDTYMHHLSESARRMWRDRLMANIDQLNVFALGGCVCVDTFRKYNLCGSRPNISIHYY